MVDSATVNDVIGINTLTDSSKLTVYPNPSQGSFTVALQDVQKGDYWFEIRNVLGQVMYQNQLQVYYSPTRVPLNLAYLDKGVYMLSVSGTRVEWTSKLIIQ